jgi:glycogen operon protein
VRSTIRASVWPGRPYPLGATWDGRGVNFALFSENAERVELCLFDPRGRREMSRIVLPEYTDNVWHGYLPEARPGQLYGYRVYGEYAPERGHRFNANKLLIDPYAKMYSGNLRWNDAHFGYKLDNPRADLSFDRRDNASGMPKCVVVDTAYSWGNDRPLYRRWHEMIVYELHVRGFTMRNEAVPQRFRGTFAGLASPAVTEYLARLGVAAVELMPVHAFVDDRNLVERGLRNYWGYNTLGFFAPDLRYLADGKSLGEFKSMVRHLHDVGIEVILDVVYNHTAEGNHLGPTLSFRGIDNASYYRLGNDRRFYYDTTGCGNTLNMDHPRVLQLVMDSLRYWVQEMHVDGFRFDLAPAIARGGGFLSAVSQDPVLSRVKLIAEPWDLGADGYRLGRFPPGWSELNDKYRDTVRRFWRGDDGVIPELASRLTASSEIFDHDGRRSRASLNFITSHDGFTLQDLVSYNGKHNEANLEFNRDGHSDNVSWNCGAEGPSDDPAIRALRMQQKRNFLATLLLSQGLPMLLAGDELGHSQRGNNNAYCQDNETSWIAWSSIGEDGRSLLEFVKRLIKIRSVHPALRRTRFFHGSPIPTSGLKDITWLTVGGHEMQERDWNDRHSRAFAFLLGGDPGDNFISLLGYPELDDSFLMLLNASDTPQTYTLPAANSLRAWEVLLDTTWPEPASSGARVLVGETYVASSRSFVLFIGHERR